MKTSSAKRKPEPQEPKSPPVPLESIEDTAWELWLLERQKTNGGRLGANLIALGYLTEEQLSSVIHGAPAAPNGVPATGISARNLLSLLLKFMSVEGCETVLDLANRIKLPRLVVQQLFDEAIQQKLVQAIGASSSLGLSIRYALSEMGRNAAKEAFDQNLYLGPAPVSLPAYTEQIEVQRIANELRPDGNCVQASSPVAAVFLMERAGLHKSSPQMIEADCENSTRG